MRSRIDWHLDEAERLDKAAADLGPKPAPVADVAAMDQAWVEATLGPTLLRQAADYHRTRAVQLAVLSREVGVIDLSGRCCQR